MNSRFEKGILSLPSKEDIIKEVNSWVSDGNVEISEDKSEKYISYWDLEEDYERKIYFPETDSLERIKSALIYDEKVKEYVDPDAIAEFIYKYIDVNALAVVQRIVLLYDEPILDEDGEIEDWEITEARKELYEQTDWDEYAYEIGLEKLGIVWVERSAVIINIREIAKCAKEIAESIALEDYDDIDEWEALFPDEFQMGLASTICHEFRHAFYEMNEFTPLGDAKNNYPVFGGDENEVECYGNDEAEKLIRWCNVRKLLYKR